MCIKMNEIVNRLLLVRDKFLPEMHLKQPGFTYSACGPFTKNKQRIEKIGSVNNEIYILGDFNIKLYINDSYILVKKNILNNKSIPSDVKRYQEFCTFSGLKQLIVVPARATTGSFTIIDHVLASFPERVTQSGVIDIALSDHHLTYCNSKISRIKRGSHKQI